MKTLNCFYDMAVSPCSFDFFTFLYSAEICRIRRKLDNIQLIFVQGPRNKFRDDNIRSDQQNETYFNNVIVPGISLLPSCSSFMWLDRNQTSFDSLSEKYIFPRGYRLNQPVSEYLSSGLVACMVRQDKHSFLEAPTYAKLLADKLIKNRCPDGKFITVTSREIERDNTNNSRTLNYHVWRKAIRKLASMGIKTFIIRDTAAASNPPLFEGVEELPEASIHLPFRLAVYERALVNFSKNNGPGGLQLYSKARAVYFNAFDDDVVALSRNWFLSNFGMNEGDQFPLSTLSKSCIWNDESENRIIDEVVNALGSEPNNSLINGFSNRENLLASLVVAFNHLITQLKFGLLAEDINLFMRIKELNHEYSFFDDLDQQLETIPEHYINRKTIQELITNSTNHRTDRRHLEAQS